MSPRRALSLVSALTLLLLALGLTLGGQQDAGPEHADLTQPPVAATVTPSSSSPFTASVTPTHDPPTRTAEPEEPTSTATRTRDAEPSAPGSPSTTATLTSATAAPQTSEQRSTAPAPTDSVVATTPGDQVAWVSLTAAGVDHPITPQGLSPQGTVNPPQGQVIWFTGYDRVEPGHLGTAVVAAHVSYRGVPDVFTGLHRAEPGDLVRVGYRDGIVMELPVVRTEIVDKGELQYSTTVWGANRSTRRVVLITCDDTYGYRPDGHRAANFVVVAEG